jgi:hypothetical protein
MQGYRWLESRQRHDGEQKESDCFFHGMMLC